MWNPFKKVTKDKVMLRLYNNSHVVSEVIWCCDVPFAAPYLPGTACQLLQDGNVVGKSYIIEWFPITAKMKEFYNKEKTHE